MEHNKNKIIKEILALKKNLLNYNNKLAIQKLQQKLIDNEHNKTIIRDKTKSELHNNNSETF